MKCECGHKVTPSDPYYATPCGTMCVECMEEQHAEECGVCKKEFGL